MIHGGRPAGAWAEGVGRGAAAFSVGLVLAAAARHGLVEPPALMTTCDAQAWASLPCGLRTLVVQGFVDQRLGALALGLAVGAFALCQRWLAVGALGLAGAGLVLYNASLSAPAALLAALAMVPRASPSRGGPA